VNPATRASQYGETKNERSRTYVHAYNRARGTGRDGKSLAISSLLIIFPAKAKSFYGATFQTAASVALFLRLDVAFTKLSVTKPFIRRASECKKRK